MNGGVILLLLVSMIGGVCSLSDEYGKNPQHEFGKVDGTRTSPLLPFWELTGDSFANEQFIRLTPDRQSKRGGVWNTESNKFQNWEVTYTFRVHGVSHLGADGFGFWYTKDKGVVDDFFGFTSSFAGLGIILDTYDNDNSGFHPLIIGIVNDGTKSFSHEHDEEAQEEGEMEIGNCQFHVRNFDEPSSIRIRYQGSTIRVETSMFDGEDFQLCFEANDVDLPSGYHFGFSAATGQLADNHDIHSIIVKNLDNNAKKVDSERTYGIFDKYAVSEMLSKIHFSVSRLEETVYGTADAGGNGGAEILDKLELLEDVGAAVLGVSDAVAELKEDIQELNVQNEKVSDSIHSNARSIDATKKDGDKLLNVVQNLERKVSAIENAIKNAKKDDQKSSVSWSTVSTYLLYGFGGVAVVVILCVVVLLIKVRSDNRKRRTRFD